MWATRPPVASYVDFIYLLYISFNVTSVTVTIEYELDKVLDQVLE